MAGIVETTSRWWAACARSNLERLRDLAARERGGWLCGVASFAGGVQQTRLDQCLADPRDFRLLDLDQRWPDDGARQTAEQDKRFFHAVVHVDEGIGVEDRRQRMDPVVEPAGLGEVVGLN